MTYFDGPVSMLLAVIAVAAVVILLERFLEVRRAHVDWQYFVDGVLNVLERGNVDEALANCDDTAVPVANIVATAIRHRDSSARVLKESVDAQGRAEVGRLNRRLAALAIIGQISPLLGLLGTVIGFIDTVKLANNAALVVRADLLSASMDALVPAALGLAVAIAVVVMYGSLCVRLDRIAADLEASASHVVGYFAARKEKERK